MIDLLSDWPALGAAGEQAWQVLRQHTEWTEGFWLAWLFTGYPPMAHELETRMEGFLNERGQRQVVLRPGTPEEVRNLLEVILAEDTRVAHCVWVEIIHSDGLGIGNEPMPGPWTEAWDWLMMRANERRTALAKHLPGGLVFVGPAVFKDRARRAAPDLWSIRALVLEPAPPARQPLPGMLDMLLALALPEESTDTPDVELALDQATQMRTQGHRADESKALMRAAHGLWLRGETAEALRWASKAVEAASDDTRLAAHALALLGRVEMRHGDSVAAERHLVAALNLMKEQDDSVVLNWVGRHGLLLEQRGAWAEAEDTYRDLLRRAEDLLQREPDNVVAVLQRGLGQFCIGRLHLMQQRFEEAAEAFTAAWELSSASTAHAQSHPPALFDLFNGLSAFGLSMANMARGDLEGAEQSLRTALDRVSRWSTPEGEIEAGILEPAQGIHWSLRFLLGLILMGRGSRSEAAQTFAELLGMAQDSAASIPRLLPPEARAVIHLTMAEVAEELGKKSEALEHAEQSLALTRRWYQARIHHTGAAQGFRFALDAIARLRRAAGDEAGARAAEAELAALPQPGADS